MHRDLVNIIGQRFGRLIVVSFVGKINKSQRNYWRCKCDCGKRVTASGDNLKKGRVASCGCLRREVIKTRSITHGESDRVGQPPSPEYRSWLSMRHRCLQPGNDNFANYGGRGIKVCARWDSFENFLADMGRRPSSKHSLDRKEVDGDYEPGNCRWATAKEQQNNRRKRARLDQFTEDELMCEMSRRGVMAGYLLDGFLSLGG